MKRILIVTLSKVSTDPRILRQVSTLQDKYRVEVVGYGPAIAGVEHFFDLNRASFPHGRFRRKLTKALLLTLRLYKRLYFYDLNSTTEKLFHENFEKYDLIVANDFNSLPLIKFSIDKKPKVLLDAHEYYFDEIYSPLHNRLFKSYRNWIATTHLSQVHSMSTVSNGIARRYEEELGFQNVSVIRNIPKLSRTAPIFQRKDKVHLIHHGAAVEGRGLLELIDLVSLLKHDFVLNLMLVETDPKFFSQLVVKAKPLKNRVLFHHVVPTELIAQTISQFDLGIFILPPLSINNHFVLPNKFFEFIQAGLGVVTGPSPEMAKIVNEHSLGVVTQSFEIEEVARILNSLDRSQIELLRKNSRQAADIFCWEEESKVLISQISRAIGDDHDS